MPVVQNISPIYRGEDIELDFTMRPVRDITGWVISMTVTKNWNTSAKVFQVTGVVLNGPAGQFRIILPSATTNIEPAIYKYDIWRNVPGQLKVLSIGNFELLANSNVPPP